MGVDNQWVKGKPLFSLQINGIYFQSEFLDISIQLKQYCSYKLKILVNFDMSHNL